MFDLIADPSETANLVGMPEHAEVIAFLDGVMAEWVELAYPDLEYPTLANRTAELLEVSRKPSVVRFALQ